MQASPLPALRSLTQTGRVSVPLDVPSDCQEVLVVLDRERFEAFLVHVPTAGGVIVSVVPLGVGQTDVMTEASHLSVDPWPQSQVIVVR
jgi:hypothetical protein